MKAFRPGSFFKFKGKSRLKPRLIIVSAPSGAGKSTLCAMLVKAYPEIIENVSFTTRNARGAEEDGVDYFFIDKEEFAEKQSRGFFAESATVHGQSYGVSRAQIETALESGRPIILDIDVQGAKALLKQYPEAFTVFIMPPSIEELRKRLEARDQGKTHNYELRIENAKKEIEQSTFFKHRITNDVLERAFEELKKLVEIELRND